MRKFEEPNLCLRWTEDAAQNLAEASFLTLTPNSEVSDAHGVELTTAVEADSAEMWSIRANFPLKPCWDVVDFPAESCDVALQALLDWKDGRPIFYRDMLHTFEFHGSSVAELVEEMRSAGVFFDEPEFFQTLSTQRAADADK